MRIKYGVDVKLILNLCYIIGIAVKMRIVSFNVNGVRSMVGKVKTGEKLGTKENNVINSLITEYTPDILCFQEIKTQSEKDLECFRTHYKNIYTTFATTKKGYSGVALMTNILPDWVEFGFERYAEEVIGEYLKYEWSMEGRIIVAMFETYCVVTVYTPNSQAKLARLDERILWEQVLRLYLMELEREFSVPIILCGDLNCAFQEIDIHNPKGNAKSAGFSKQERDEFNLILEAGFVDSFRHKYPDTVKYTYWSNFRQARQRNMGWRIDYLLVSEYAKDKIIEADCLTEFYGSDHCPVLLSIDL